MSQLENSPCIVNAHHADRGSGPRRRRATTVTAGALGLLLLGASSCARPIPTSVASGSVATVLPTKVEETATHPGVAFTRSAERSAVPGLEHGDVVVNGVRLHYLVAGQGEPVLLLHGWPESSVAWTQVIPQLVKAGRRVWALDYRGAGQSDTPASGYDLDNVARDVHAFIESKHLADGGRGVDIVGHDIGTWIGHALAVNYPADIRRLVLSEALVPGITSSAAGVPDDAANLRGWQFGFNRLNDLPEVLVQGRERAYLAFLFETKSVRRWEIDPATLDEYVREYSAPGVLRAGFAYYRTNYAEAGLAQARARAAKRLTIPVLAIGGGGGIRDALEKALQPLAADVQGAVLEDCGHFLPEECPDEFVHAVTAFWGSRRR